MKSILHFERGNVRWVSTARCTIGFSLPILVAALYGRPALGVLAALGALYAGLSSFRGPYIVRMRTMVATSFVVAAMTGFAGLLSMRPVLSVPVIAALALLAAVYGSSSLGANILSVQSIAVLVVIAGLPSTAANPLGNAALVLAGGLLQSLLLVVFWPFFGRRPERRALSEVFTGFARFVRSVIDAPDQAPRIPDRASIQQAWDVIEPLKPGDRVDFERILLDAEAIRAALAGFARSYRHRAQTQEERRSASDLAVQFDAIGRAIFSARPMERRSDPSADSAVHGPLDEQHLAGWLVLLEDLVADVAKPNPRASRFGGQSAPSVVTAKQRVPGSEIAESEMSEPAARAVGYGLDLATLAKVLLRPDLRLLTEKHAIRYGLAVGAAVWLSHHWALGHAYWLPLTVCLTLRGDYASTIDRGLARVFGTILGVAVAEGFIELAHPGPPVLVGMMLIGGFIACLIYLANYMLFAAAITLYVIGSVSAASSHAPHAGMERLTATAAGAALSVLTNFLVPIWQSRDVARVLRDAVQAQVEFAERFLASPDPDLDPAVRESRQMARALHIEAERVVAGAGHEPAWSRPKHHGMSIDGVAATDVLDRLDDNAAVFLTLQAVSRRDRGAERSESSIAAQARAALVRSRELLAHFPS